MSAAEARENCSIHQKGEETTRPWACPGSARKRRTPPAGKKPVRICERRGSILRTACIHSVTRVYMVFPSDLAAAPRAAAPLGGRQNIEQHQIEVERSGSSPSSHRGKAGQLSVTLARWFPGLEFRVVGQNSRQIQMITVHNQESTRNHRPGHCGTSPAYLNSGALPADVAASGASEVNPSKGLRARPRVGNAAYLGPAPLVPGRNSNTERNSF